MVFENKQAIVLGAWGNKNGFFAVLPFSACGLLICTVGFLGLCPSDSFDEALADSLSDGALDLRERLIKIYYEQDAERKVMRGSTIY